MVPANGLQYHVGSFVPGFLGDWVEDRLRGFGGNSWHIRGVA
jgi:hypothetical protein